MVRLAGTRSSSAELSRYEVALLLEDALPLRRLPLRPFGAVLLLPEALPRAAFKRFGGRRLVFL